MRTDRLKFKYAALVGCLCLLASCQQDEMPQMQQKASTATTSSSVPSRSVTCEVTTTEAGTLIAKLDEIATAGGYVKEDITDLTISGPVTQEDLRALRPFTKLSKLDMTGLTIINEDGNVTDFFPDETLDSLASPAHIYMPTSISIIGNNAFRYSKIKAVEMPNNVTTIFTCAFYQCKELQTVHLSDSIEIIYYNVFDGCNSLTTINVPEKLREIYHGAFRNCAFSSFTLPETIELIDSWVFAQNPNLININWSSKVTEIPDYCFYNCPKLNFEIPNNITKIGDSSFRGCTISSFTLPETIESLGSWAFAENTNLININWPSKVTVIPSNCFYDCPKLKFEIPNTITRIEHRAFGSCTSLTTDLVIPSSVEYISSYAFEHCYSINIVTFPSTLTEIAEYVFNYCTELRTVNGISNWTKIPEGMFQCCTSLNFEIPAQVDTIGNYAFNHCESLNVALPKQLKYLGESAFRNCYAMSNSQLPSTLKYIGSTALEGWQLITEFDVPEGVEHIGRHAFHNTSIKELTIPSTVQTVEDYIVTDCEDLQTIYWKTSVYMPELFYSWNNHNTLIYAPTGISYHPNNKIMIFGDDETGYICDQSIEINTNRDFYCPKAFTAKEVVYRKHYGTWTYPNQSCGWYTISLPFTVTRFVIQETEDQPERELRPFGTEDMGDAKPFWLRTLHSDGFGRETMLEAGKPYIIAFPYNPEYYLPEYNINGTVEFWGENVTIIENTQLTPIVGPEFTFCPTFERLQKSMDIYNIDYNSYTDRVHDTFYYGGSLFRSSIRDTERYEAYLTNNVTGRSVIAVENKASSRAARTIGSVPMEDDM